MLGFMTQVINHKVSIRYTKKTTVKCVRVCFCARAHVCVRVCLCARARVCVRVCFHFSFSFPGKNDGSQLHLEENIYSIANIKMTSSIIIYEGKPDEECGGLSRECYFPTPSYEGYFR
jgi:hypothetical protein